MEHARKLLLVDPNRYTVSAPIPGHLPVRLKESIAERKLSSLDRDIANALNDDEPDDVKAKRYAAALLSYRMIHDKSSSSSSAVAPSKTDAILDEVPKTKRRKAKRLLEYIKPHVRWSEKGEIASDGRLVRDSDIADLLTESVLNGSRATRQSKKKQEAIPGWVEYVDALKGANVPEDYISNQQLRSRLYDWEDYEATTSKPQRAAPKGKGKVKVKRRQK